MRLQRYAKHLIIIVEDDKFGKIFWITEGEASDPHDFIASQREVSNTANEY